MDNQQFINDIFDKPIVDLIKKIDRNFNLSVNSIVGILNNRDLFIEIAEQTYEMHFDVDEVNFNYGVIVYYFEFGLYVIYNLLENYHKKITETLILLTDESKFILTKMSQPDIIRQLKCSTNDINILDVKWPDEFTKVIFDAPNFSFKDIVKPRTKFEIKVNLDFPIEKKKSDKEIIEDWIIANPVYNRIMQTEYRQRCFDETRVQIHPNTFGKIAVNYVKTFYSGGKGYYDAR